MRTLDFSRASRSAAFHASAKFPHWGWLGNVSPDGEVPCGWRAVVIMLSSGRTVNTIKAKRISTRVTRVVVASAVFIGPARAAGSAG